MKKIILPNIEEWSRLVERPKIEKNELDTIVKNIINEVKTRKDQALIAYSKQFDNVELNSLQVTKTEIEEAKLLVSDELKNAIFIAQNNIEKFHQNQQLDEAVVETTTGVKCWRKAVPIEKVGLYIPGGSAPLFSSILMLAIPAKIAGCKEIILCTPPNQQGKVHPAILYTANLVGATKIFKVGGAQAIAAMAYGTESIPQMYKIFGPGNQYVTKAKELVQQNGVAIDMPAGPSEVLIIADETCNPEFVAADLLSQAEHGSDSQVILLSDNTTVIDKSIKALNEQVELLPRAETAKKAIQNSCAIQLKNLNACMEFSNLYAPEHLILASDNSNKLINAVINAGSVFIGNYSCESAGDYASGTNHTLPTNAYARNYSGVSLSSFQKNITFQKITAEGIQNIGPAIEIMAEEEGLFAHKNAVSLRLKSLKK